MDFPNFLADAVFSKVAIWRWILNMNIWMLYFTKKKPYSLHLASGCSADNPFIDSKPIIYFIKTINCLAMTSLLSSQVSMLCVEVIRVGVEWIKERPLHHSTRNRFINHLDLLKQHNALGDVYRLIQKTKQPQWNFIADSCFSVVNCKKRVVYVFYLLKAFIPAPDFKGIFIVNIKISLFGH